MKTPVFILALAAFSALMLSPKKPVEYPPQAVLDQRREITHKEIEINKLIQEIEVALVIDSIIIKTKHRDEY